MSLTITATLDDLTGTANSGSVVFTLCGFGQTPPLISGHMLSTLSVTAAANGSGAVSQVLLGNDVITPAGTYYNVQTFSSSGSLISSARYSLTGSGTVDLSTLTPF
jgi:hypothetical protein